MTDRCDDYCCNHGCNQERDCPAGKPIRTIKPYPAVPQRQPLTDEVHNAFLQGIRYAANKYEVVLDEMFTGGDVSNFLLMEAEELDSSDITRAIETSNGIKEQA